ncbi:MAG: hypothetical protein WA874_00290 [Chryseosolibacter sp.]
MDKEKLPHKITEYITGHFREDFLFEVKEIKQLKDHTFYTIEVSKDNYIDTLRFNENGVLVQDESDEAFPAEAHDEAGFGNVPD